MHEAHITIEGRDISYMQSRPSGPALFFVHGNSSSKGIFARQFESKLADHYRIIAIDLPGHGASSRSSDGYEISMLARSISQAARALDAEDAVFVGHSLGGHVLLQAIPSLSRAKGFVIFGSPPLGKPPALDRAFLPNPAGAPFMQAESTDEALDELARAAFAADDSVPAFFAADFRRTDPTLRVGLGQALLSGQMEDETMHLAEMTQPIAVLHGSEDRLVNSEYIRGLTIPTLWRGEIRFIEEARHFPQWEQPHRFNETLSSLLDDLS